MIGDGWLVDLRLLLLSILVELQELIAFIEFFLLIFLEEGSRLQTVPLRDQYFEVGALNSFDFKLAEVEQVWHQVSMWEDHAFVSELIEPRVRQCID